MVGTKPKASEPTVTEIKNRFYRYRFVSCTSVSSPATVDYDALAALVVDLITEHTTPVRGQRAALWELLKRSVRIGIDLARQNTAVHMEWFDLHTDLARLRAGLCAVLGQDTDPAAYAGDERVLADLRELAGEARLRENEVISLGCEVEKLERALSEAARDSQSAARFVDTMLGGGR